MISTFMRLYVSWKRISAVGIKRVYVWQLLLLLLLDVIHEPSIVGRRPLVTKRSNQHGTAANSLGSRTADTASWLGLNHEHSVFWNLVTLS